MDATAPTLALHGELTISCIGEQRSALLQAVSATADAQVLDLDLHGIDACDSAGVQLLLSARLSLAARGAALRLTDCSPPVREVLHTYGLQSLLENAAAPEGVAA